MNSANVRLSSLNLNESGEYRAVSHLAVASLILGILSVGALATPVLWCVPVLCILIATVALRAIAKDDQLVGRSVALVALAMALLFGTWGPCHLFALRAIHVSDSRKVSLHWLGLLGQGRLQEAHQLTMEPYRRLRADMSLKEFYTSREAWRQRLGRFLHREGVHRVAEAGIVPIRYVETIETRGDRWKSVATQRFALHPDNARPFTLRVTVHRLRDKQSNHVDWLIFQIDDDSFESA